MINGHTHLCMEAFHASKHTNWTMKRAFFADMGGFLLESPDEPLFPINSHQLLYLVNKGYISPPNYDEAAIDDKNKHDGLARYDDRTPQSFATLTNHVY